MSSFQADTDQMRQIGSRLTSVVAALDDEAHNNFDTSALGFPEAVSGLSDFISGWSHGRSEISASVKDVQQSLHGAAGGYDAAEGDARRAFEAGGAK
jgi:hypothetical protein